MVVKINNQDAALFRQAIEQQIGMGEPVELRVTGNSMRPYLKGTGNESVIVSIHRPEELKRGTIILFIHNERFVFHRIIKKKNGILIAQGDGNCVAKEEIRTEEVLGIVRLVVRRGGKKTSPYSFPAQIYWRIWYLLRPIRKYLLVISTRCGMIGNRKNL